MDDYFSKSVEFERSCKNMGWALNRDFPQYGPEEKRIYARLYLQIVARYETFSKGWRDETGFTSKNIESIKTDCKKILEG